ncbi:VOC family protein [Larkinella sp. VNQ87]|uniref:VOC family protein n=1 Tax=Larkinella sp. VNQ87 TaxID=3400921 RepID=UPI003C085433
MTACNIYLNFNGQTEEAFRFYQSVFGGEFAALQRFREMPDSEKLPPETAERILHIALPLGKNAVLMGSDTMESMGPPLVVGTNFSISISTESQEEADMFFKGLSSGGIITMPMEKVFWGAYFGMLTDQFGIQWMISFDENYV